VFTQESGRDISDPYTLVPLPGLTSKPVANAHPTLLILAAALGRSECGVNAMKTPTTLETSRPGAKRLAEPSGAPAHQFPDLDTYPIQPASDPGLGNLLDQ